MAIRQWTNNTFVFTKCWVYNTNVWWSNDSVNGVCGIANWYASIGWSDNSDNGVRGTANWYTSVGGSRVSDNGVRGTANWWDNFGWSNDSDNDIHWFNDHDYVAFILHTSASISVGRWHLPLD